MRAAPSLVPRADPGPGTAEVTAHRQINRVVDYSRISGHRRSHLTPEVIAMNDSPLSQDELTEYYKERPAMKPSLGSISKTFFIAGNGEPPRVETRIRRTEVQLDDGTTRYELRVDVDGVELGARTKVSGLNRIGVRGPAGDPPLDSELLSAFVPDHLAFDLRPKKRVRPHIRIPRELERGIRYNTTIFGDEDRDVFRDTSYPWGAFGRCETNFGPFSGVMIGPRHILTCNHGVDWTPPPGYDADWLNGDVLLRRRRAVRVDIRDTCIRHSEGRQRRIQQRR